MLNGLDNVPKLNAYSIYNLNFKAPLFFFVVIHLIVINHLHCLIDFVPVIYIHKTPYDTKNLNK